MRGSSQVEIEWMPSHLEEKDNIKRKNKYIKEGGLEQHIDGNVQADILAKEGAEMHSVCDVRVHLAEQRRCLTMLVQSMMVDIWTAEVQYRFPDDPDKAISAEDIQDREQMLHLFHSDPADDLREALDSLGNAEENFDDFFGNVDINGEDIETMPSFQAPVAPQNTEDTEPKHNTDTHQEAQGAGNTASACATSTTVRGNNPIGGNPPAPKQTPFISNSSIKELVTAESSNIKRLYPSYVYEEADQDFDDVVPAKPFNFCSPPKPNIKVQYQNGDLFHVPFDASWWDSLEWFFTQLRWSHKRLENTPMINNTITFLEITIAYEIVTGNTVMAQHDLATKNQIMQRAFLAFWQSTGVQINGKLTSYKQAFGYVNKLGKLRSFGIPSCPGISRRPCLDIEPNLPLWVACNVRAVAALTKMEGNLVGAGFRTSAPHVLKWKARALVETDLLINKAIETRRNKTRNTVQLPHRKNKSIIRVGPCAYGCLSTTSVGISGVCKWQRPPNHMLHLHSSEAVVCQRCYTLLAKGMVPKDRLPSGRPPDSPGVV